MQNQQQHKKMLIIVRICLSIYKFKICSLFITFLNFSNQEIFSTVKIVMLLEDLNILFSMLHIKYKIKLFIFDTTLDTIVFMLVIKFK